MKKFLGILFIILFLFLAVGAVQAELDYDKVYKDMLKRWTRSVTVQDSFLVQATFWNEELVQAWVAKYGKENLLSSEEQLAYHRDFIQREQLGKYLMFEVTIKKLKGAPLYPLDFGKNTYLLDDKGKKLFPINFPKEFTERIFQEATGKVYFSRFDKDGNPFITSETKSITLFVNKVSLDPGLVSTEVKLEFLNPYIAPDYSRPEWKPSLEEEVLRLEERIKELELKKERLEEEVKRVEEEIQKVKDTIRELQKMK
ncbi:MAG: hypothetical protein ACUVQZ_06740 [Candidatus Caldatribacteriaceae bacterium]